MVIDNVEGRKDLEKGETSVVSSMMFVVLTSPVWLFYLTFHQGGARPGGGVGSAVSISNNKSEHNNEKSLLKSSNIPIYYIIPAKFSCGVAIFP